MLKKIPLILAFLWFATASALAAVDVNTADQAALDGIAGVGPSTSKAIIDERNKRGNYKDWSDLEHRVKGIGERNAVKLSAAGMLVNGQPRPVAAVNTGKPKADKADKAGKLDKGDNPDKLEKSDKADKADKSDKAERMERAGKMDRSDKAGKSSDLTKASDNLK